ncbi:hypothetical protein C8A03DRAFT_29675 [Achaetomium macrosporum]|uniref:Stc1 domain-containing protein n=1 Tax=Achaetomium macrosporum TaxID=79813 RepID=A0AAN7CHB0_9PEZI|nr:hypothetical protein C8A03DRAFT_29675 [Achaetomium macrosporum]
MESRLRCESGEWKARSQFSKKQLEKYDRQARNGYAAPAKTGIRCLEHAPGKVLEIQCNGPCTQWRELRFYSKSTRRNGKNWCIDCTDWQLRTENGEALPPPGAQLSVEEANPGEVRTQHGTARADEAATEFNDDESSAFDHDTSMALSNLSISESRGVTTESRVDREPSMHGDRPDKLLPPDGRHDPAAAPHWLMPEPDEGSSRGSVTDWTSTTGDTMTAGPRGGRVEAVSFNAWGPNGERVRMTKTPTVASVSTRNGTTHAEPVTVGRSGWAKVPTRKQPPQLPDYLKKEESFPPPRAVEEFEEPWWDDDD